MNISLAPDYYTQHAIDVMLTQFSEYLSVQMTIENEIHLDVKVVDEYLKHEKEIINAFLNGAFELSIQELL